MAATRSHPRRTGRSGDRAPPAEHAQTIPQSSTNVRRDRRSAAKPSNPLRRSSSRPLQLHAMPICAAVDAAYADSGWSFESASNASRSASASRPSRSATRRLDHCDIGLSHAGASREGRELREEGVEVVAVPVSQGRAERHAGTPGASRSLRPRRRATRMSRASLRSSTSASAKVQPPPIVGHQHSTERIAPLDLGGRGLDFGDGPFMVGADRRPATPAGQRSRPALAASRRRRPCRARPARASPRWGRRRRALVSHP